MLEKAKAMSPSFKIIVSNLDQSGKKSFLKHFMAKGALRGKGQEQEQEQGQGEGQERKDESNKLIHQVLLKDLHHKGRNLRVGIIGLLGPDAAFSSLSDRKCSFVGYRI